MNRRRFIPSRALSALVSSVLIASIGICQAQAIQNQSIQDQSIQDQSNGVPSRLMKKLYNGVNVTRWFNYLDSPTDYAHMNTYFTRQDWQALAALKVTFVRLCVAPEVADNNGTPNLTSLKYIDSGVEKFHQHHIAVLWDLHDNGQLHLDAPNADTQSFVNFWAGIAKHYRGLDEDSLVFELMNEPQFMKNPEAWYAIQQKTVDAIRAVDPERTILCSGTQWSSIDQIANLTPLVQKNIIYTVHCYDPFTFTHQGATWVGPEQLSFKDIPFPSSPEAVASMINEIPQQYQHDVTWYGQQKYGQAYLMGRMQKAAQWGIDHHVPVLLGEFGAYPPVSPPASRKNWFTMMYKAIVANHLPHSVWGYDDAMGLGRTVGPGGNIHLDPMVYKIIQKYGSKGQKKS